jgi:hypothetical protein
VRLCLGAAAANWALASSSASSVFQQMIARIKAKRVDIELGDEIEKALFLLVQFCQPAAQPPPLLGQAGVFTEQDLTNRVTEADLLVLAVSGQASRKPAMVALSGLEPLTLTVTKPISDAALCLE